jgi:hypothetical protein
LKNVEVYIIYWGPKWNTDSTHIMLKNHLNSFFESVLDSAYISNLREYSVPGQILDAGTFAGSEVINPGLGNPVTDQQVRQQILIEIAKPGVPDRNDNIIYLVAPEQGLFVRRNIASTNCNDPIGTFCGYHDSSQETVGRLRYAVLGYPCTNNRCLPDLDPDAYTRVASQEVFEAITDPDYRSNPGWTGGPVPGFLEVGDVCFEGSVQCPGRFNGFFVNPLWSNRAQRCVIATPLAKAEPTIEEGSRILTTTFAGTQQANDNVIESFLTRSAIQTALAPLIAARLDLRWDAAVGQWQKATVGQFQRMIYYARVMNIDAPTETRGSLWLFNYSTGAFNRIGDFFSLS